MMSANVDDFIPCQSLKGKCMCDIFSQEQFRYYGASPYLGY